ncbi:hypothetical protein EQ442_23890 [Salmonella enterica]|nr:hypothetical protein [Salmonella enterica]
MYCARNVIGSVIVGGVPPSHTISVFQRATEVISVPAWAKLLIAPATEPIVMPVNGASQLCAIFIAAPWVI